MSNTILAKVDAIWQKMQCSTPQLLEMLKTDVTIQLAGWRYGFQAQ